MQRGGHRLGAVHAHPRGSWGGPHRGGARAARTGDLLTKRMTVLGSSGNDTRSAFESMSSAGSGMTRQRQHAFTDVANRPLVHSGVAVAQPSAKPLGLYGSPEQHEQGFNFTTGLGAGGGWPYAFQPRLPSSTKLHRNELVTLFVCFCRAATQQLWTETGARHYTVRRLGISSTLCAPSRVTWAATHVPSLARAARLCTSPPSR